MFLYNRYFIVKFFFVLFSTCMLISCSTNNDINSCIGDVLLSEDFSDEKCFFIEIEKNEYVSNKEIIEYCNNKRTNYLIDLPEIVIPESYRNNEFLEAEYIQREYGTIGTIKVSNIGIKNNRLSFVLAYKHYAFWGWEKDFVYKFRNRKFQQISVTDAKHWIY